MASRSRPAAAAPCSFTVTAGTLPPGLSLSVGGSLWAHPRRSGLFLHRNGNRRPGMYWVACVFDEYRLRDYHCISTFPSGRNYRIGVLSVHLVGRRHWSVHVRSDTRHPPGRNFSLDCRAPLGDPDGSGQLQLHSHIHGRSGVYRGSELYADRQLPDDHAASRLAA